MGKDSQYDKKLPKGFVFPQAVSLSLLLDDQMLSGGNRLISNARCSAVKKFISAMLNT